MSVNWCFVLFFYIFNIVIDWGEFFVGSSFCFGIKMYLEKFCECFLILEELEKFFVVFVEEESFGVNLYFIVVIRFVILIGVRIGEIKILKWEFVDLERWVFELLDSKIGWKKIFLFSDVIEIFGFL